MILMYKSFSSKLRIELVRVNGCEVQCTVYTTCGLHKGSEIYATTKARLVICDQGTQWNMIA